MSENYTTYYKSPIGYLEIIGSDSGIRELRFTELETAPYSNIPGCLENCIGQLDEYFSGRRKQFDLQLRYEGTDFQQSVWQQLLKIQYGQTRTYMDIAIALNNPKALRAVGAANGQNPIPIIIPCHRVIGRNGQMIGFGGGIWRKEYLLKHEKALLL